MTVTDPWGSLLRRDHVLVMGMPGCGKTPFAADLAADARRVVYFDPTGEWSERGERVEPADLGDMGLFGGTFLRLVVTPSDTALLVDFVATVEACRAAAPFGGLVLLVDECGDLNQGEGAEALRSLHRNGHKDGIATVLCSPCATDFPARCRSTATRVFTFWQKAAADIRALDDEYGDAFGQRAHAWRYPAPPVAWVSPTLHK